MRRHLNRTGRVRIERRHVDLTVRDSNSHEAPIFDLTLETSPYRFPADARVRVEAWRDNAVQRWEYGTVGALVPPPDERRRMVNVPESAQFRVFVVAGDGSGRLLGHADKLRPVLPRRSLLPLVVTDLGNEVWRVSFGDDGDSSPELLVNNKIESIGEVVGRDDAFRSLVLPGVLRAVLTHTVLVNRFDPNDRDEDDWWMGWFRLAEGLLPGRKVPHLSDGNAQVGAPEAIRWIDEVVDAFSHKPVAALSRYAEALRR